jgi:CBS domain-containing protein
VNFRQTLCTVLTIMKSISPFVQKKVVVLHDNDTVQSAARAMRDHRIGFLVVADHQGHLTGVLTDRDIVARALADGKPNTTPIRDCMSRLPVMVDERADLDQVIDRMQEFGVRRIPVVEKRHGGAMHCAGVIALDDVIAARAIDLPALSRIVRAQLKRKLFPAASSATPIRTESAERFFETVASHLSTKAELTRSELEQLTYTVVGAVARRMHHTGALELISQLPSVLQPALAALPSGPDQTIHRESLLREIARDFQLDAAMAATVLTRFGAALAEWCDPKQLGHVRAQLPEDLRSIFPAAPPERTSEAGRPASAA